MDSGETGRNAGEINPNGGPDAGNGNDEEKALASHLAAQALGRRGGLRRLETTSPERRSEIARLAAKRRWDKGSDT